MRPIKRVTLRHVEMPLLHPFTTSFGTQHRKQFILVEVQNADGMSGWGESAAFPEPYYNEETLQTNWHILKSFLIPLLEHAGSLAHPDDLGKHGYATDWRSAPKFFGYSVDGGCQLCLRVGRCRPLATT